MIFSVIPFATHMRTKNLIIVVASFVAMGATILGQAGQAPAPAAGQGGRGGGAGQRGQTGRPGAPIDLTGYWVSVVTEDWRWRMMTPAKGDFASIPTNPAG